MNNTTTPALDQSETNEKLYKLLKQIWYQWATVTAFENEDSQYKLDRDFANFKRENGIDHL